MVAIYETINDDKLSTNESTRFLYGWYDLCGSRVERCRSFNGEMTR